MKRKAITGAAVFCCAIQLGHHSHAADEVEIIAPESSVTVKATPGSQGVIATIDGWSCGVDVIENAVAVLSELSRRRSILTRQVEAGKALAKTPAIQQERAKDRRLRIFDDAVRALPANDPDEIRAITRREEQDLTEFDGFRELRTFSRTRTELKRGGITDEGMTEIYLLPDCMETSRVEALAAQIRNAATDVGELRDDFRQVRDAVAAAGGA